MEPGPNELEGPFFNTVGWEKDHNGVHPVEMLARIAKFESKPEAVFQPYRKNLKNKADHDCRKVQICKYDGFMVLGNGKLEKQAKLVSARNMIVKIKTKNIGIVNETLAAGVTLEVGVNPNPHKKPLARQFKSFTSGGTLGTFKSAGGALAGFVAASASDESSVDVVKPPVCSINDTDTLEIEQYQAYLEGKIETPTEKLPQKSSDEVDVSTLTPAAPKIVFKRSIDTEQSQSINNSEDEPSIKKSKADNEDDDHSKLDNNKFTEDSSESSWDSSNYGYQNSQLQTNWRGRGRARGDWNQRGYNNRGWNNIGGYNNRGGYGNRGGFNQQNNGYYGYGYGYGGYGGGW